MTIKHPGFMASQATAVNHLGILIAFGLDGIVLAVLIPIGGLVTPQQLVALGVAQLFDPHFGTLRGDNKQIRTETTCDHFGATCVLKLKSNVMEGAFGEFQIATRAVEQILPELGIMRHEVQQPFRGWLGVTEKFIGAIAGVVNKPKHVESDLNRSVGSAEGRSIGFRGMTIEQNTRDESPVDRRVATALASAMDGISLTVTEVFV